MLYNNKYYYYYQTTDDRRPEMNKIFDKVPHRREVTFAVENCPLNRGSTAVH